MNNRTLANNGIETTINPTIPELVEGFFYFCNNGIIITDPQARIVAVNPAFTRITGYNPEEAIGQSPALLSSGMHDKGFYRQMWQTLHSSGFWCGEIWNRRKNGDIYQEILAISTYYNPDRTVGCYIGEFMAFTAMDGHTSVIQQAHYDSVVGLPNRAHFTKFLEWKLLRCKEDRQRLALMFIDLDHFKAVNDTLGHDIGDLLLKMAAQRIQRCIRENDFMARIGGDEFTIVLTSDIERHRVMAIAESIIRSLERPFNLHGNHASVSASIGIACSPDDASDFHGLMRHADQAMYAAKRRGRGCASFFCL